MKKEKEFVVYYHKSWFNVEGPLYHKTVYAKNIDEAVFKVVEAASKNKIEIKIYGVFVPVENAR